MNYSVFIQYASGSKFSNFTAQRQIISLTVGLLKIKRGAGGVMLVHIFYFQQLLFFEKNGDYDT
jgi:hypothetical protein